jgi:hypothetical protein
MLSIRSGCDGPKRADGDRSPQELIRGRGSLLVRSNGRDSWDARFRASKPWCNQALTLDVLLTPRPAQKTNRPTQ